MKILLIRYHNEGQVNTRLPESLNKAQGIYPPLGIAYIAANLENHGFPVEILDVQALNLTSEEARQEILKRKPDIVGITSMTSTFSGVIECSKFAKEAGSKVLIGGPQTSMFPKETLSFDSVDFINIGDAEQMIVELCTALEKNKSYTSIVGLGYKDSKGNVILNKPSIIMKLDELPFPARHLLPMEKYDCIIAEKPFTTMIATRGCPYHCGFCFRNVNDWAFRSRSAMNITDEIQECVEKYGTKYIMFYDETMTMSKSHTIEMCEEIIRRGLHTKVKWEAPTRADKVDRELLSKMKQAGCVRLRFGVESGNERILEFMNKKTDLNKIRETFRNCHELGIESFAYFVIGYFSEDESTIIDTINFAKELNPDWVMFTAATPLPNTPLWKLCVDSKLVKDDYWLRYSLGEPTERIPFIVPDTDKWVKRAYREFYFRPSYIAKKLTKIRSFDTIKKYVKGGFSIVQFQMTPDKISSKT